MPSRPRSGFGLGRVLGVVHQAWRSPPRPERVHQLVEPHRVRLGPDLAATVAVRRLLRAGVSGAPVYRHDELVGFFSPHRASEASRALDGTVAAHMSRRVPAVRQSAPLTSVVQLCGELRVAELQVVDDDRQLIGRVTLDRALDALSA